MDLWAPGWIRGVLRRGSICSLIARIADSNFYGDNGKAPESQKIGQAYLHSNGIESVVYCREM